MERPKADHREKYIPPGLKSIAKKEARHESGVGRKAVRHKTKRISKLLEET
jgi:hypothetical protein